MKNTSKSTKAPVSAKMIKKSVTTGGVGKAGSASKVKRTSAPATYLSNPAMKSGSSKTSVTTDQLKKTTGKSKLKNKYSLGLKNAGKGKKAV